jgi:hypothetical protein
MEFVFWDYTARFNLKQRGCDLGNPHDRGDV